MKKIIFFLLVPALAIFSCSKDSKSSVEPDVVAPTVDFSIAGFSNTTPGVAILVSNQIEININAQDSGGISKVEAFINDEKVGEDSTAPFQIIVDISSFSSKKTISGKYKDYVLEISATDIAGNTTSTTQTINIDNELPTISGVSIVEDQILNGDTNELTFSVSDNEGLESVAIYLNDELLLEVVDENYATNIDSTELQEGSNILRIEAKDDAGNIGQHMVNFIVDNTGPLVSIENFSNDNIVDQLFTVMPEVTDNYSEISQVEFLLGEEQIALFNTSANYDFEFDPRPHPTGTNTIIVKATDNLGNESITEFPIEIYRRLITINMPSNFYNPQIARIYVFASDSEGKTLSVRRIEQGTEQVVLRTMNNIDADAEFSLTFGEYYSGSFGNSTELTTLQNLRPSKLGVLNLKTAPRFDNIPTSPVSFPINGFDSNDVINTASYGFGYSGGYNSITQEFSTDRRRNTTSTTNTDIMYIPLDNNTLNEYRYLIVDWDLPSDFILDYDQFTQDGIEQRFYQTSLGSGDYVSSINFTGYFNEDDYQNNVWHNIGGSAYGFLPAQGGPYFYNTGLYKSRYEFTMKDYYTARNGEPLALFTDLNWSIDHSMTGKEISIIKSGMGHHIGKIYLGTESPQNINGLDLSYGWNIIFNSETSDKVVIPEIPEEMQTWGFYEFYQNDDLNLWQVEIKRYEGISSYDDYLDKIIKDNNHFYTISPIMESKFQSVVNPEGYYFRGTNFLLD